MEESRECRIRRLIYRSHYTSMKETDRILGAFAKEMLATFDGEGLDAYEALLDFGDAVLWAWVSGAESPPPEVSNVALDRLRAWCEARRSVKCL